MLREHLRCCRVCRTGKYFQYFGDDQELMSWASKLGPAGVPDDVVVESGKVKVREWGQEHSTILKPEDWVLFVKIGKNSGFRVVPDKPDLVSSLNEGL